MAKLSYDKILKSLLDEEEALKFPYFSNDTALDLGFALVEQARREKAPMTIDITRNGQQLFHAALPGTLVDNDRWVERKNRVVNQLHHSSMYYHYYLLREGKTEVSPDAPPHPDSRVESLQGSVLGAPRAADPADGHFFRRLYHH
ncbi:MAG: heme-binding protein [Spirochaetia bacterium]|jgi:uncharacterized protein (UPF0303 family)|nr:heme-binding protein [Spirochaetia bacterium]